MENEKRIEILVFGQVQGVFFRQEVKRKADELGIIGWAKNLKDGSVEIIAEGGKEALEKLTEWCKVGTEFSQVKDIKIKWLERTGEFSANGGSVSGGKNFEIL